MGRTPRVALAPEGTRGFLADAIRAGGAELVDVAEAEALVWADPHHPGRLPELLAANPGIRWIQLPWAGIEPMVEVLDTDHTWTCGKGVYADDVAEHALALALAGLRHLVAYARTTTWSTPAGTNLRHARVTLLGGGAIARALLALLEPHHCQVTVVRRHPDPVPGASVTTTLAGLDDVLPATDLLVLALALTPETDGVIDGRRLARLPAHAWLVNVARGRHVVTDDLVAALDAGRLGGAALDVTDPEPLPVTHPLWSRPNCLITPHTANTPEMALPALSARVTENVRRFAAGEELLGLVDVAAGY